jgi:hypothetical protein
VGFCLHKLHKRSDATSQVCANPDGPTSQGQTCLKQHGPNGSGTKLAIGKLVEPMLEGKLSINETLPNNLIRPRVLITNRHNTQAETMCQTMSKSSVVTHLDDTTILQQVRPLLGRPGLLPRTAAVLLSQYLTTALSPTMSPILLEVTAPRKTL